MATRVFVDGSIEANATVEIRGEDHHHLTRALRCRVGDPVVVSDGRGHEADGRLVAIDKQVATIQTAEVRKRERAESGYVVHAVIALIKGERMDYAIQKLVELGVASIIPVLTERTVVTVEGARAQKRGERFDSIARSAARQCHRAWLPEIVAPEPLAAAYARLAAVECRLVLDVGPTAGPIEPALPPAGGEQVAFLAGPEGGLTDEERAEAEAEGFSPVSLGPLVLRAETAALVAAAIIGHVGRSRAASGR